MVKSFIKKLFNSYIQKVCKDEFVSQKFTRFNERPVEFSFVFRKLAEIYPQDILDVGSGVTALPHLMRNCGFMVSAIDNVKDYWKNGMINRHYYIIDDDITKTRLQGCFDLITCISVLEHIENFDIAIRNMVSLLKPNGYLLLTFPYNENAHVKNVYTLPGSSYGKGAAYITQSFSRVEIDRWVKENSGCIKDQEFWQYWSGDHWTVGEQIIPPRKVSSKENHQLLCLLIQLKS